MAIIECKECNKKYSDKAEICPNCACPTKYNINFNVQNDSNKIINSKEVNNKDMKKPNNSNIEKVVSSLLIIILLMLGAYSYSRSQKAINIVKNSNNIYSNNSVDEQVKIWVKNKSEIQKIYGWKAYKVQGDIFFVKYMFDKEDDNYRNGHSFYSYEVSLNSEIVEEVSGNEELRKKYINLGYIDE